MDRVTLSIVIEVVPESYITPLDLTGIFGRDASLEVDLGCGDGTFLTALARQYPERNFLGIERLLGRVRSSAHKAQTLENVRVLRLETSYAIRYLLPRASVERFHLLFPDPWPKRRHQRRRTFNGDFLEALIGALEPEGRLHIATDQRDYFEEMKNLSRARDELQDISDETGEMPATTFEKRFRSSGLPIYRLELRKISPVT